MHTNKCSNRLFCSLISPEKVTNAEWHTIKYCTLPKTNDCFQTYQVKKVYVETLFSTSYWLLTNRRPFGSYLFLLTCDALYFKCQIFWKATKEGMCYMHGIYVIVGFYSFFSYCIKSFWFLFVLHGLLVIFQCHGNRMALWFWRQTIEWGFLFVCVKTKIIFKREILLLKWNHT